MPEFHALSLTEATSLLLKAQNPIIMTHAHPDGDTVGSAVALANIFSLLGKEKISIYFPDDIPARLSFDLDYCPPLSPIESLENRTILSVDVAAPHLLSEKDTGLYPEFAIDHHSTFTPFTDYYTIPGLSSAGEVVYVLLSELIKEGHIKELNFNTAASIYSAISSDTGCFKYNCTTPTTHRIAASLMEKGIPADDINHKLFDSKTLNELRAEALTMNNIQLYENGRIAIAAITKDMRSRANLNPEDFEASIDILRSLFGVEIAIILKETSNEPGTFRISFRSTGANVAEIASCFEGGGHERAAGGIVHALSAKGAINMVISKTLSSL